MAYPGSITIPLNPMDIESNPTEYLFKSVDGFCPITDAEKRSLKNELTAIIDRGANVNARDKNDITPLGHAVLSGNETAVECLLERGADPNVEVWNNEPDNGSDSDPDPNKRTYTTLLGVAVRNERETETELLLTAGADQNQQPMRGRTAKKIAEDIGNKKILSLLKKHESKYVILGSSLS